MPFSGGPSLNLQFAGSTTLDPRITFTRASTGTYFDSAGVLQSAAINAPRFDYDPTTLQPLGLLIEEARTNLVLNSATLSTQSVTVTAVTHTLSFYGTGTVTITGTGSGTLTGSGAFPTRSTLTFTPTAGGLTLTVTGSVTQAQLEAGGFATSYIPTTSASATRAIDVAVISTLTPWYNATAGTLYVEGDAGLSVIPCFASIDDTTQSNRIQLRRQSSDTLASFRMRSSSSSGQIDVSLLSGSATGVNKQIAAFSAGSQSSAANGELITGITSLDTIPVVSRLDIGNGVGSNILNGYIRQITYYPRRMSDAELQSLTA
jgi:hypothetical protein